MIGIGTRIGSNGQSWAQYWATQTDTFLFFGEVSKITDGKLYNQMVGSSDYLNVSGSVGSYTFQAPDNATYKTADSDYIWFRTDSVQRTVTTAELIGYDFARTLIKYDDLSPYDLRVIAILKPAQSVSNKMRDDFHLSVWWDNTFSYYGYLKQNRPLFQQYVWQREIVDADGNFYTAVVIAGLTVLVENLKTTKYNDGSSIPTGLSNANWALEDGTANHDGAFAEVNGNAANKADYGLLYNWHAVNNAKGIAPIGYHVMTNAELATIITGMGGASLAGGRMKETGLTHWTTPNTSATNISGFTARPGGDRNATTGAYASFGLYGTYHTATAFSAANSYRFYMAYNSGTLSNDNADKRIGNAVRCVKTT